MIRLDYPSLTMEPSQYIAIVFVGLITAVQSDSDVASDINGRNLIQRCPTDLMIIIDNSGSVRHVFDKEKDIAASLIDAMDIRPEATRVAYLQFSSKAELVFPFDRFANGSSVARTIRSVEVVGYLTRTALALRMARLDFTESSRPDANRIILMITDGHSQSSPEELREAIDDLKHLGVTIYVATASDSPDLFEMDIYTYANREQVFLKNNVTAMPPLISRFIGSGKCLAEETPGTVEHPNEAVMKSILEEKQGCGITDDVTIIADQTTPVLIFLARVRDLASVLTNALNLGSGTRVTVLQSDGTHAGEVYLGLDDEIATKAAFNAALENVSFNVSESSNDLRKILLDKLTSGAMLRVQESLKNKAKKLIVIITAENPENFLSLSRTLLEMQPNFVVAVLKVDAGNLGQPNDETFTIHQYSANAKMAIAYDEL